MLNAEANNYQYVFLGGILGELLELKIVGNYLKENEKILREMGIDDIHPFTLNSLYSADKNAEKLNEIITREYLKREKKFIIFAHSKGCLEVILAMTQNFEFFRNYVEKIICVQPPFQGSGALEHPLLSPLLKAWPGLRSLKKNYYAETFQEELIEDAEKHQYLKDHVLVIRGFKSRSRDVSWIIRPFHYVMKRTGDANDGLLKYSEQVIPSAPYEEMVLEIDHSDLFTSKRLSKNRTGFRRDMMVNLINSSLKKSSVLGFEDVVPTRLNDTEICHIL